VLADRIRDQSTIYRTIVLAGHSMGGILAKAAVCELIKRNDLGTLASVRALLLMAAPQAGSLRTPGFLWRFSEDGRVLKAHGDLITEIQRIFTDRVIADPHPAQPAGIVIPAFVVAGAEDNWVDQFSAGLNVHSSRMNNIRGSHTSAVKPRTRTDDGYKWVRDRIRDIVTRSVTQSPADTSGAIRAARGEDDRIVVVRVHRAFFSGRSEECHFINVTNLSPTRVVEITHVWYEDENHHIPVVQVPRLLPARLDLDASWETWIESSALPREHRQDASSRFRVRISTGRVFCSEANTSVPPMGFVPGGAAR